MFDRSAEADVGVRLGGQEHMFPWPERALAVTGFLGEQRNADRDRQRQPSRDGSRADLPVAEGGAQLGRLEPGELSADAREPGSGGEEALLALLRALRASLAGSARFRGGTGVGTARAFPAPLARLTHVTMRVRLSYAEPDGRCRTRTCDFLRVKQALYQLS